MATHKDARDTHAGRTNEANAGQVATTVLHVGGLNWASEKAVVEGVLGREPGVWLVEANPVAQTANVRFDTVQASLAELRSCAEAAEAAGLSRSRSSDEPREGAVHMQVRSAPAGRSHQRLRGPWPPPFPRPRL